MCTLIVLDRVVPGFPLLVASNRDEFFRRPSAPPARISPREEGRPAYVAPQDLEAGGTWMGLNARGLFVGLTNRAGAQPARDRRSRGLLVLDALARETADEVETDMQSVRAGTHNPFHLLAADGSGTMLAVGTETSVDVRRLDPGAHVICNRDPEDPASSKVRDLRSAVRGIDTGRAVETVLEQLADVLRAHGRVDEPLQNPCVHTEDYGTRSSTLIAVGAGRWHYWHSDGPPCEAKYRNLTGLLDELRELA